MIVSFTDTLLIIFMAVSLLLFKTYRLLQIRPKHCLLTDHLVYRPQYVRPDHNRQL